MTANGNIMATPAVPGGSGRFLDFPGVVVGDINSSGGNEIFVIAASRMLAFNQNGQKLWYKQFVDPNGSFTNFKSDLDTPNPGSPFRWGGRRYGIYQLNDVNGDGDQELIVAADKNNINNNIAGAVYEAYNISASAQPDGYIGNIRLWRTWIMNSTVDATPANPQDYRIGVPLDGITDVNGDGIVDIILTENVSGIPVVRAINARTGAVTATLFNGICIGVKHLDTSQSLRDLIVYDPTTFNPVTGLGTHMVWRFNQGTYTPFRLLENPSGTLASAAIIRGGEIPDNISLSTTGFLNTGVNNEDGHFYADVTRSSGVRAFLGYSSLNCPSGLFSWTTSGGIIQRSLNLASRPGQVVDIVKVNDGNNFVWILNLESSCISTNIARTAVQSGSSLVANGDL